MSLIDWMALFVALLNLCLWLWKPRGRKTQPKAKTVPLDLIDDALLTPEQLAEKARQSDHYREQERILEERVRACQDNYDMWAKEFEKKALSTYLEWRNSAQAGLTAAQKALAAHRERVS